MPFILAGGASGPLSGGRALDFTDTQHSNLLVRLALAMGQNIGQFGQASNCGLTGLLSAETRRAQSAGHLRSSSLALEGMNRAP